jgi:hypothetical protein
MSQPANEQSIQAPRLRRLPAIDSQPPFDDEFQHAAKDHPWADVRRSSSTQGALTLAFALPSGLPSVPAPPPSWRPTAANLTPATAAALARVANAAPEVAEDDEGAPRLHLVTPPIAGTRTRKPRRASAGTIEEEFGPQPTPRSQLPEPSVWAARLVQAFVEVDAGLRPATQLIRWTTTAVHEAMSRRSASLPLRTAHISGRQPGEVVRSVRSSEPVDGVVEVSAVIQRGGHGGRCRAMALRLEGIDGRWQCTALETR